MHIFIFSSALAHLILLLDHSLFDVKYSTVSSTTLKWENKNKVRGKKQLCFW